jgi:hypothetical protein
MPSPTDGSGIDGGSGAGDPGAFWCGLTDKKSGEKSAVEDVTASCCVDDEGKKKGGLMKFCPFFFRKPAPGGAVGDSDQGSAVLRESIQLLLPIQRTSILLRKITRYDQDIDPRE